MKKILIAIFALMPIMGFAQSNTTLTPEQKLEQAQKQLEEAQKAVEEAKANALKAQKAAAEAKAKAEAEAKAKADAEAKANAAKAKELAEKQAAIQEQIKKAQDEAARLNAEAERLNAEANKLSNSNATTTPAVIPEKTVSTVKVPSTNTEVAPKKEKAVTTSKEGWSSPEKSSVAKPRKTFNKNKKNDDDESGYLEGAVPEESGNVVFTLDYDVPGKTAQEIYDITYNYMNDLTQDENQKDNGSKSSIALVNKDDYEMAARLTEWIVFTDNVFSLDRSEMDYTLIAKCTDGHLHMTMGRINYNYEEGRNTGFKTKAEESITDKYSLTKKKDKLNHIYGKFRKATIDRKNVIFNEIEASLK
ncbi:MAG: DUF4468 domain-containing protein [Prevotella sp.]|jgi:chemotaxis protein histidine kinase CheA|nr:DUF4468 domain-containing protein [Prevotella sp.]MCI1281694.1 DUF4468 domain-containing protein [Prevotella sp.]